MQTVGQFPNIVKEIENEWIPLADGCRLAARMWMPEDALAAPVPAILEYIPYRKRDGTAARDALTHPYLAGHGYVCVRVDMRGNGESDGVMLDEYVKQEQDDALEIIDWITAQPWCDGFVGMMGISWGGFNGLQVAARGPDSLKAVITLCSTDDRYVDDIHYKGGCLLGENMGWSGAMLAYSSKPPGPDLVGDRWRAMRLERLEIEPFLAATWLKHQHRDDYWKHGSVCEDLSTIKAAILAVGGWGDAYSNVIPRLLAGLSAPCRGITGPWHHEYPHFAVPEPRIGFLQEALRWWDHWLKGLDTGVMDDPLYRAYLMDSVRPQSFYAHREGRWIAEDTWPSERIGTETLVLGKDGLRDRAEDTPWASVCSPQDTGQAGGEFCIICLGPELPGDQRADDAGSLVWDSETLEGRKEIFGAVTLDLEVQVDRPQANLAVRLCDVAPNGSSTRVTWTVLNLCHRDSHDAPTPLTPGKTYQVRLKLDDIAYAFPVGHRIRVAISTAYWPMIWPSPEPVTLKVHTGVSSLNLPVRDVDDDPEPVFPPVEAALSRQTESMRNAEQFRTIERDVGTGEATLRIVDDFGEARDTDTGLSSGTIARETYRIYPDDPLSARVDIHWTETLSRNNAGRDEKWSVRTETWSTQRADAVSFLLAGRIEAYEGDALIFEKDFKETIPRNLV